MKLLGIVRVSTQEQASDKKTGIKAQRQAIEKLAADKADKKSQRAAIAGIEARLKPLDREIKTILAMRRSLKKINTRVNQMGLELAALADADTQMRKGINEIKSSVKDLSGRKINRELLELELLKLKKQWQLRLSNVQEDLSRRLDVVQKQISSLRKISRVPKQSMKSATKKHTAQAPSASGSTEKSSGSDSSGIIEQDISE